jgi:hypothetical protein
MKLPTQILETGGCRLIVSQIVTSLHCAAIAPVLPQSRKAEEFFCRKNLQYT